MASPAAVAARAAVMKWRMGSRGVGGQVRRVGAAGHRAGLVAGAGAGVGVARGAGFRGSLAVRSPCLS